jgi:hypothetical protein
MLSRICQNILLTYHYQLLDLYYQKSIPSNVQALGCHFTSLAHMHSIDYLLAGNKTTVLPTVITGKARWFWTRGQRDGFGVLPT